MTKPFEKIAFIGLGLIASSMAWRLKAGKNPPILVGTARSQETRDRARELGFCDEVLDSPEEAVKDADLVMLCTPVGAMGEIAKAIGPHLKAGAVVSDVGSVKQAVIDIVSPHLPESVQLVPAHPIAGTENSGPDAGFSTLFENRWCIVTPIGEEDDNTRRVVKLWEELGSYVDIMDPSHHDLTLAVTSHVPHLIAYTMVGVADDLSRVKESEVIKYSASGFRDFTRIAASDPVMWRDVFLNNKEATLDILGRFTEELFVLQHAIRLEDGEMLRDYFTRTRAIRKGILEIGQDVDVPDFGRGNLPPKAINKNNTKK